MLKLTKKNKKKHKHKKGKEEELFTQEELERYKQQQAEKAAQAAAQAAEEAAGSSSAFEGYGAAEVGDEEEAAEEGKEANDEWQKFKQLTAGVDDILKKSQGDLGRIKETSYFQRKPPGPSEPDKKKPQRPAPPVNKEKRWVGFEEGAKVDSGPEPEEPTVTEEPPPQQEEAAFEEAPLEFEEEEEEPEPEDDGLFDTSYVDVVTSGDIKLAYIPDSPPPEPEDDPFDTSIVDKVIKPTEIITKDGKKKKLVSLGCAVDVLTGRLDKAIPTPVVVPGAKKRRVVPRDLLLDDGSVAPQFDESPTEEQTTAVATKSLLDDDSEVIPDDLPIDVPVPVAPVQALPEQKEETEEDQKPDLKNLVAEFDVITTSQSEETLEFNTQLKDKEEEEEDEFAALAAESVLKSYDPFDTTAADIALGENNLKQHIPGSPDVDVLLRSDSPYLDSTEPLSKQPPRPPPPKVQPVESEVDPFDTTFAENLVPGKVELQLIESEILGGVQSTQEEDDDFDFDPRAGEQPKSPVSSVTIHVSAPGDELEYQKSQNEDHLEEDIPEPVPLKPLHRDLLGGSSTDLSQLVHDPIEPKVETDVSEDYDPFDTSVADVLAPGKAELRFLEQELLDQQQTAETVEDEEFDPRKETFKAPDCAVIRAELPSPSQRPDLLAAEGGESTEFKPLTPEPGAQKSAEPQAVDPFDTSFAENIAPGKAELKVIESELVLKHSLSDDEFNPRQETQIRRYSEVPSTLQTSGDQSRRFSDVTGDHKYQPPSSLPLQANLSSPPAKPDLLAVEEEEEAPHKPLTPAQETAKSLGIPDDPFDTSQVSPAIAPGPAELRLLESELRIDEPPPQLKRSYTDEDFNPRDAIKQEAASAEKPDFLHIPDESTDNIKPLSPQLEGQEEEIDPFDTSFAGDLLPGRAELKLLEAELIGQ